MPTEMTYEAAIIELNRLKSQERRDIDRARLGAAIDKLTEAGRYQIKRKVVIYNELDLCPNCRKVLGGNAHRRLSAYRMPHCYKCGQALDWSD